MSIALRFDVSEVVRAADMLHMLAVLDTEDLLDNLGSEVTDQVQRRISEEKAAPDGTPWPQWSERYAATRHAGQSLLENEGNLIDSIQHLVEPGSVTVGSNLIYAAHQNFGGGDIGSGVPAREFLGFSAQNLDDLEALTLDWLRDQLAALQ